MKWGRLVWVMFALCFFAKNARAGIVLGDTYFMANAPDGSNAWFDLPFPVSTTLSIAGPSGYSKNEVNMDYNGAQTVMRFDMQHRQTGSPGETQFGAFQITITPTTDEPYELSGYYNVEQLSGVGSAEADVGLTEGSTSGYLGPKIDLFRNNQGATFYSENVNFGIPGNSGGKSNELTGISTGELIAGHHYYLSFSFYVLGTSDISAAQAVGNLTLTIGNVPEPTSATLVAFAAMIFGMQRSRKGRLRIYRL